MVDDAGVMIENQRLQKEKATLRKSAADFPYTGELTSMGCPSMSLYWPLEYLTLDELHQWLDFVADEFPDVTELKQIGTTAEDRPIMGFHLGDKNNNSDKKKIFMGEYLLLFHVFHCIKIVASMQGNGSHQQLVDISSMKSCKPTPIQTMK